MELTSHKILALVVLGVISLFFGLLPLKFKRWIERSKKSHRKSKKQVIISGLLCFGAGVLLATVFIHILPETREGYERAKAMRAMNERAMALENSFMTETFPEMETSHHTLPMPDHQEVPKTTLIPDTTMQPDSGLTESRSRRNADDAAILPEIAGDFSPNLGSHSNSEVKFATDKETHERSKGDFVDPVTVVPHDDHSHSQHDHDHDHKHDHHTLEDTTTPPHSDLENLNHNPKFSESSGGSNLDIHGHSHDEHSHEDHGHPHGDHGHNHEDHGPINRDQGLSPDDYWLMYGDQGLSEDDFWLAHGDHGHDQKDHLHPHDDHGHTTKDHGHKHDDHDHTTHHGDNKHNQDGQGSLHDHGHGHKHVNHGHHHEDHEHTTNSHTQDDAHSMHNHEQETNKPPEKSQINGNKHDHHNHDDNETHDHEPSVSHGKEELNISPSLEKDHDVHEHSDHDHDQGHQHEQEHPTHGQQHNHVPHHERHVPHEHDQDHDHRTHEHGNHHGHEDGDQHAHEQEQDTHDHDFKHSTHNHGKKEHLHDEKHDHDHDEHAHDYPYPELMICLGFFLIYVIEEVVHKFLVKHSDHHSVSSVSNSTVEEDLETGHGHSHIHVPVTKNKKKAKGLFQKDSSQQIYHGSTPGRYMKGQDNLAFAGDIDAASWNPSLKDAVTSLQEPNGQTPSLPNTPSFDLPDAPSKKPPLQVPESGSYPDEKPSFTRSIFEHFRALLVILALSIHGVFEGLVVGLQENTADVWYITFAISAHHVVISFCVGMEFIIDGVPILLMVVYMVVLSLVAPVGACIGLVISENSSFGGPNHELMVAVLQGLAGGTILYVVFLEILERERHKRGRNATKLFCFILGFAFMAVIEVFSSHSHGPVDQHAH